MTLTRARPSLSLQSTVMFGNQNIEKKQALPRVRRSGWLCGSVGWGSGRNGVRWRPQLPEGILIPPGLQCESPPSHQKTRGSRTPPPLPAERKDPRPPTQGGEARVWSPGRGSRGPSAPPGGLGGGRGRMRLDRASELGQTSQCHPSNLEWDVEGPITLVTHPSASGARLSTLPSR